MAAKIIDTQEVVEVAQQFTAHICDTQDAVEVAQQFAVSITSTQDVIEVIYFTPAGPSRNSSQYYRPFFTGAR
jgi:hypothetical protein